MHYYIYLYLSILLLVFCLLLESIQMDNLRLYFITWNVATKSPEEDLHPLLELAPNPKHDKFLYDFYVIGLQEVKAQPQNMLFDVLFDDPWTNEFRKILEIRNYVKVKSIRLQGLILIIFTLRRHLLHLRDIEAQYTRTGLNGMWGNKGAVSIRLGIYGCSICIVNAHLTAHEHMLQERIDDYNAIIKSQEFHVKETTNILFHDYVFWIGDLNFRLSGEATTSANDIIKSIKKNEYEPLLAKDQLHLVMEKGEAFSELKENTPTFPPTYKYEIGKSEYDIKRRPSWCDRILFRVTHDSYENVTLQVDQRSYQSHTNYVQSDHKPVTSDFNIKVFADYTERVVEFCSIPIWYLDEVNSATIKLSRDVQTSPNDWIAIYKDGFSSLDDYLSYVYVVKGSSPILGVKQSPARTTGVRQPPRSLTVNFSESAIRAPGMYRLVYFSQTSQNVQSVLGMSEAFHIQKRELDLALNF